MMIHPIDQFKKKLASSRVDTLTCYHYRVSIKQGMYLFSLGEKIECLNKIYFPGVYKRFDALADFLGCSKKALAIRMKQLGLLKKEYLDNPFDLVTVYPEVSEL